MTVELWYGSKPTNLGEQNVLIHLYDHLLTKAEHFVLLCNFMPGRGNEIDLMVLKSNGFFLAELKHYWSEIRGGREGAWHFLNDDQEAPFENPYKQVRACFFGWRDWFEGQRTTLQTKLGQTWQPKSISPWSYVVFYPELHADSQINLGDQRVSVLGLSAFRLALEAKSDAKINFAPSKLAEIPKLLNLTPWKIEPLPEMVKTQALPDDNYQQPPVCMLVSRGPEALPAFHIQQDRIVVGRAPGCDLVLHDVSVSRLHAEIYRKENYWVIHDLDSVNHTFVSFNGDPNAEHKIETANAIKNGSLVRFGHVSFTFLWSE